jgi:hypothetical protein
MKSKAEILIHQTRHPLFREALELVRCFDVSPGTPNTAAAMSLVFDITGETDSQQKLGNWLGSYIEPFLLNPIRDEQNLPEKALAIATYIFIAKRIDLDYKLPDEYLINFIEYASEQSWFGDHFLAFYCHYLKDQLVACEGVDKYFSKNYEKVLAKKHIPAISQSLIVLHGSLTDLDSKRGIDLLTSLLNESNNISYIAWGLWAFSVHNQTLDNLVDLLQHSINSAFIAVRKDSGVLGLLILAAMGGQSAQLHEYLKRQAKLQEAEKVKISLTEDYFKVDLRSIANARSGLEHLSIFSLCIGLVSLKNSKREEISYISGLDSQSLAKISDRLKRLSSGGGVDLSRIEKNLLNVLIVVTMLLLIGIIFYFQIGGGLSFDNSNLGLSKLTWEEIVITISLIDYLLGTIEAARMNGNALEGLLKLPILRHWQSYQGKRNK